MPNISLGKYSPEFQGSVERLGGKLGILDFLGRNTAIHAELRKLGIHISPGLQVLNPENTVDGIDIERLSHDAQNLAGGDSRPFIIIRGSVPGDFRSLVDIIPTQSYPIYDIRNAVEEGVSRIIECLGVYRDDIEKYARGMDVPYNEKELRIGVAPYFHVPILTATEHPNDRGTILLDTFYGNYDFGGHNIQTVNYNPKYKTSPDGNEPRRLGFSISSDNAQGKKIEGLLSSLRKIGVLDATIAYQFEFGVDQDGILLLFQVREFCKMQDAVSPISEHLRKNQRALFSALEDGKSLDNLTVITGEYHAPWERILQDNDASKKFLLAGTRAPKIFSNEYDPRVLVQFHTDVGGGSMNHDSFRTAQSVMQSGGVVGLGYAYTQDSSTLRSQTKIKREGHNLIIGEPLPPPVQGAFKLKVPERKKS